MKELHKWAATSPFSDRAWLIVGKGPTFSQIGDFDMSEFNVITLNHSILEVDAQIAHIIDIDVVEDCGRELLRRAAFVAMPRVPHVRCRPGHALLEDYVASSAVLSQLDDEGRLIWYNAETGPRIEGAPVIEIRYFSSEAALGVVGELGARVVRTIGVDGGASYASSFSGFDGGLLANGLPSFDQQFTELRRIAQQRRIDLRPLVPALRVFVGAGRREMVPYRVLAHSIHRRASRPVRVEVLPAFLGRAPRRRSNRPRTAFSFSRFLIPSLCDHDGLAVYLDSDMLVFEDIAELFAHDLNGVSVGCTTQATPDAWRDNSWFQPGRQFSVMLLDCSKLDWDVDRIVSELDAGGLSYEQLLFDLAIVDEDEIDDSVDPAWNSLESFDESTKLLHFTVVPKQPWLTRNNPLREVWLRAFRDAVSGGAVPRSEVAALVASGGASDLVEIYDEVAPTGRSSAGSVRDVALDASFVRIDQLEGRLLRTRVRKPAKALSPLVRRVRARWGASPITDAIEGAAELARRVLR